MTGIWELIYCSLWGMFEISMKKSENEKMDSGLLLLGASSYAHFTGISAVTAPGVSDALR